MRPTPSSPPPDAPPIAPNEVERDELPFHLGEKNLLLRRHTCTALCFWGCGRRLAHALTGGTHPSSPLPPHTQSFACWRATCFGLRPLGFFRPRSTTMHRPTTSSFSLLVSSHLALLLLFLLLGSTAGQEGPAAHAAVDATEEVRGWLFGDGGWPRGHKSSTNGTAGCVPRIGLLTLLPSTHAPPTARCQSTKQLRPPSRRRLAFAQGLALDGTC